MGATRGTGDDLNHSGAHWLLKVNFFRGNWGLARVGTLRGTGGDLNHIGSTPLKFNFESALGTMGTTRGTGDALNHIGIRWLLAFTVYLQGWGLGTGDTEPLGLGRGQRRSLKAQGI